MKDLGSGVRDSINKSTEDFLRYLDDCSKQVSISDGWRRSVEFQQELENFGIDCLKAMREEIKSSSSNDHERLQAISASFQRVMAVLPKQEV